MRAKDIFIHDVLASSAGWHPQLSNSSPKPFSLLVWCFFVLMMLT
jgi:hypothetical protein